MLIAIQNMLDFRKIFISYAREDIRYALLLNEYLERLSYEPWLDKKKLLPGSNWELEINRALKESDFIILLLSATSVSKRGYVQREYKQALRYSEERLDDDIYIIPVLINECEVPESLKRFHWIMFEEAFPAILTSLEKQRRILLALAKEENMQFGNSKLNLRLNSHEFTAYDITLITLLAQGLMQKHIPQVLQGREMQPSSLSSIEKRLTQIREALSITKNEQLVAYCKDMGII